MFIVHANVQASLSLDTGLLKRISFSDFQAKNNCVQSMQMSFVTVDFEYALSSVVEKKVEGDGGGGGGGGEPDNGVFFTCE